MYVCNNIQKECKFTCMQCHVILEHKCAFVVVVFQVHYNEKSSGSIYCSDFAFILHLEVMYIICGHIHICFPLVKLVVKTVSLALSTVLGLLLLLPLMVVTFKTRYHWGSGNFSKNYLNGTMGIRKFSKRCILPVQKKCCF